MTGHKPSTGQPAMPAQVSAPQLRRRAEDIAKSVPVPVPPSLPEPLPAESAQKLLHELQLHQLELELQNDELHRIRNELETARARYFDLYDLAPIGYFTLSEQGIILDANLCAATMLGMSRDALTGQLLSRFVLQADRGLYFLHSALVAKGDSTQVVELRITKADTSICWVRLEANRTPNPDNVAVFRILMSDITERRNHEERLGLAAAIFEGTREGLMVTDVDERTVMVNQAFCQLTGYRPEELQGKTPRLIRSGRQDAAFYAAMWEAIRTTGSWQGEIWNRRKNGEIYPHLLSISAVKDDRGRITHYVGVYSDITQIRDATDKLYYLAHHDPLTGLPNRLLLLDRLQHSLNVAQRERKSLALLMLDLDRFKDVNDGFGHLAGDELLVQVARRLTERLRDVDTVVRLGGDEFAVLLEGLTEPQDAAVVASEIIEALSEPYRLSKIADVRIGASVGISLFPDHSNTAELLLQHADAALYRAKSEGRGKFNYFSDDLTQAVARRLNLESMLRRALARRELLVHYQPQVDIATGRIIGAEALARWFHPQEGPIPPAEFIPVAEVTGQIAEIGAWVLGEACRQGRSWIAEGLPPFKLAVNVSPHQFRNADLCAVVAAVLTETGFPPDRLVLELTEGALMERETEALVTLRQLRALGIHLAIDDFGTGYSSLAHLKRFPFDILKIDKSFIDEIPSVQDDKEIAAAIVAMGHILGMKIVAEGVETGDQFDFLKAQACDVYQGSLASPAVPAAEFAALLRRDGGSGSGD